MKVKFPKIVSEKVFPEPDRIHLNLRGVVRDGEGFYSPPSLVLAKNILADSPFIRRVNDATFWQRETPTATEQVFLALGETNTGGAFYVEGVGWEGTSVFPLKLLVLLVKTSGNDINSNMSSEFEVFQPLFILVGRTSGGKTRIGYYLPEQNSNKRCHFGSATFWSSGSVVNIPSTPTINTVAINNPNQQTDVETGSVFVVATPRFTTNFSNLIRSLPSNVVRFKTNGSQRTLTITLASSNNTNFAYHCYHIKAGSVFYLGQMTHQSGNTFTITLPSNTALSPLAVDFRHHRIGDFLIRDEQIIDVAVWSGRVVWLTPKGVYISDVGLPFLCGQPNGVPPTADDGGFVPISEGLGLRVSGNTALVLTAKGVFRLVQQGEGVFVLLQTDLPLPYRTQYNTLLPRTAEADGWYQSLRGLTSVEGEVVGAEWNNFRCYAFAPMGQEGFILFEKSGQLRFGYYTKYGIASFMDTAPPVSFVFQYGGKGYAVWVGDVGGNNRVMVYEADPSFEDTRLQTVAPNPTMELEAQINFPSETYLKKVLVDITSLTPVSGSINFNNQTYTFRCLVQATDIATGQNVSRLDFVQRGKNILHFPKRLRTKSCILRVVIGWYNTSTQSFLPYWFATTPNGFSTTGRYWVDFELETAVLERQRGGIDV